MQLARALALVLIVAGTIAACGGGGETERAAARCDDTAPGPGATFATADVAFAAPEGEEVQSARDNGGYLPWFAKFGLYVRGSGDVVIRVPAVHRDDVNMVGWGAGGDDPPRTDIRIAASRCWTGYPGGLIFTGRPCVRLRVEGPGSLRGTARFGLRRACGPETLTRRERFLIARAEVVFATLALEDIDHAACVDAAGARRCAANGEKQTAELVDVLRAHPDGIYDLPDEGEVTVTELVAKAADDLREHRPELAAELDAALN
ncbi:MAG TPA: hypothetical protein VFX51_14080 [Solirubrobacteraceae bacterium]|nr:hypothetical protein [Solirubrobacteraceae bacterium]